MSVLTTGPHCLDYLGFIEILKFNKESATLFPGTVVFPVVFCMSMNLGSAC